ncbi:hybrid sensor histidine kinase/response regulator [Pedobacter yulinensis]|uniref:Sensory/regulatory protein RpfC n=1 Tax=Pedobacter yulinensis TaxID=2126353 RepID=A0A2T3HQ76_9SPHI|nr:response regulator [Pedobacter yulinensis]PST84598.1 hybrid sensor histidine kinase/response regulator [Pedobacter yulinensis]
MEKINVLLVDDRPENIIALEALLDRPDINIISTTMPNEALRICWEKDIAIALIDVQMPEMDGFELVEILKSNPRTQQILFIFVTAISKETKYAVKGLNTGAVDYLYKPLDPFVTSAKVDAFVQLVRVQRELRQKNILLEKAQRDLIVAKEEAEQGKKIKENFLANMSHEIRTPINGIIGLVSLLQQSDLPEAEKEMLQLLQVSSDSLLGVINDILDLSKIESGKFRISLSANEIDKVCKAVINLLNIRAREKNIKLVFFSDPLLPAKVMLDSLRLNQILMNLIGNAIKFTDPGGSVSLDARLLDKKGDNVQVEFRVTDTGIGIAKENLTRIFDSFEQADEQTTVRFGGTGLGLSIVKKLAELMGGIMHVESESGKGSSFSFTNWYQVVEDSEKTPAATGNAVLPKLDGLQVLVAEDNPINKFLIMKILKDWNIQADAVDDGQQALDKLARHPYDLVLMDTYMPVMNGLEAIRLIRDGHIPGKERIPIITFSAAVMESDRENAINAGADDILGKPFDQQILHEKIIYYTRKPG